MRFIFVVIGVDYVTFYIFHGFDLVFAERWHWFGFLHSLQFGHQHIITILLVQMLSFWVDLLDHIVQMIFFIFVEISEFRCLHALNFGDSARVLKFVRYGNVLKKHNFMIRVFTGLIHVRGRSLIVFLSARLCEGIFKGVACLTQIVSRLWPECILAVGCWLWLVHSSSPIVLFHRSLNFIQLLFIRIVVLVGSFLSIVSIYLVNRINGFFGILVTFDRKQTLVVQRFVDSRFSAFHQVILPHFSLNVEIALGFQVVSVFLVSFCIKALHVFHLYFGDARVALLYLHVVMIRTYIHLVNPLDVCVVLGRGFKGIDCEFNMSAWHQIHFLDKVGFIDCFLNFWSHSFQNHTFFFHRNVWIMICVFGVFVFGVIGVVGSNFLNGLCSMCCVMFERGILFLRCFWGLCFSLSIHIRPSP